MILAPALAAITWHLTLLPSSAVADTLDVVEQPSAPMLDGSITESEYGAPAVHLPTAAGNVPIWLSRNGDYLYIAAIMPDSTFAWGDDFVVSLDPMGRGSSGPSAGDRQWYLRRVLDSSNVMIASEGGWFSPGQLPPMLGPTRQHADWDVASSSSAMQWTVELRVRFTAVKPGDAAPRIAFRTYNNEPRGWWSWPAAPEGVRPQRVEHRPDLWIPIRVP